MNTRNASLSSNRPVVVEALEGRRLLSATGGGTAVLAGGALHVTGTKGADLIVISMNYSDPSGAARVDVRINNAVVHSVFLAEVTQGLRVDAGKGDDTVRLDESAGLVPLTLRAYGGQGNDTLVGSSMDDFLHGGAGRDVLYGNDGNDSLFGDQGKDMLAGGFGDDLVDGGNGSDLLYGEAGADVLFGGNGKDTLDGGDGNDSLDGGNGLDLLTGAAGADLFARGDRSAEILDKADEDTHEPAHPGQGHGRGGEDLPEVESHAGRS